MGFHNSGGGGSGDRLTETVLWTNSSYTSRFAAQNVTLSEDVNNYDYLKFVFFASTGDQRSKCVIYTLDEFKGYSLASNQWSRASSPMRRNSGSNDYPRGIAYVDGTTISFSAAQAFNVASTNNDLTIPYQVIGIKREIVNPGVSEFLREIPSGYYTGIGSKTLGAFPAVFTGGYNHHFIGCVKGYTTMSATHSGNSWYSISGIKADGTRDILSDGSSGTSQANSHWDITDYDYIILTAVQSSAYNETVSLS